MKNKLWCDLKTDQERAEFLLSGRAHETGIIAQSIVDDVAKAFAYRAENESKNMPVWSRWNMVGWRRWAEDKKWNSFTG